MDLLSRMIEFEEGSLDMEGTVELFQELVNNGMAWTLQGFYGRTAAELLRLGMISQPVQ